MRLGEIDFPQELITAIRAGELVVFAGAGVSKGPPANLPLFKELAVAIAEGSGKRFQRAEAIDQFLGRLASAHRVEVNEIAAQVLTESHPQPTNLHKDLLRLFKGGLESIRLVTTNFDLLFESASEELFGATPSTYRASALPRGDEFSGIVHVHGDVNDVPNMVLTDADFGKAYLTGGWARRFLVALFQAKPVLFVGYSHSDLIMDYLARAIPVSPETPPRFILTDDCDTSKWSRLGIQPTMFPPLDFAAQNDGIAKLATAVSRGAADWRDWIRDVVKAPPTVLSDEDAEMLKFGLTDATDALTNVKSFTENAQNPGWIDWLDRRGVLDHLFEDEELEGKDALLAGWLASRFARSEASSIILLIGRKNMILSPTLWHSLAWHVGLENEDDGDALSSGELERWVTVILAKARDLPNECWVMVFERCVQLGRFDDALAILDRLVEPNVRRISTIGDKPFGGADVQIGCSKWQLGRVRSALSPHLPAVADRLLTVAARHLASQHRQQAAWELADRDFSQTSLHRERIRDEADSSSATAEDVLIDLVRDALVQLAQTESKRAETWLDIFASSDAPLLRRIAISAMVHFPE